MINTLFNADSLAGPNAMLMALAIGFLFGTVLEQAGFGSSRRLAGIFYFRDMSVLKVMFTAIIVAMIGLSALRNLGMLQAEAIYILPTVFGPQIIGGLIFGIGFVMSGWCPGTGAVGLASGRGDALVFLLGAGLGSILFNELYGMLEPIMVLGLRGVDFAFVRLGMGEATFAILLTLVAVSCFWLSECIERARDVGGKYLGSQFLKVFSVLMVFGAVGLTAFPRTAARFQGRPGTSASYPGFSGEVALLQEISEAKDHMEPEELADRLLAGDASLRLIDLRSPEEYAAFHLRGAVNAGLANLPSLLRTYDAQGLTILYSNGMTHPAQARDALVRLGYQNVYILTDGLAGFMERCLKPSSLRTEPQTPFMAEKIASWRHFFLRPSPEQPGYIK